MKRIAGYAHVFWLAAGICAAATSGPSDPTELGEFVDKLFNQHMAATHTLGAVFVLVKNGQVMLLRGYGLASLERKTPVVPEQDTVSSRIGVEAIHRNSHHATL